MGKCWPYELRVTNKRLTVQCSTGLVLAKRRKGQRVLCLRPRWALRATASCVGTGGDSNRCQPVAGMSWGYPDMCSASGGATGNPAAAAPPPGFWQEAAAGCGVGERPHNQYSEKNCVRSCRHHTSHTPHTVHTSEPNTHSTHITHITHSTRFTHFRHIRHFAHFTGISHIAPASR